ncbi:MAG: nuclear transport factor 2 family protein, partial [Pseudomonadota bacterium]
MSAREFVKRYEAALATQDWAAVAPLISDQARVVFSSGALHAGKDAIRAAYEHNFSTIKGEEYRIENVQ